VHQLTIFGSAQEVSAFNLLIRVARTVLGHLFGALLVAVVFAISALDALPDQALEQLFAVLTYGWSLNMKLNMIILSNY
jgi:hypothetical protein